MTLQLVKIWSSTVVYGIPQKASEEKLGTQISDLVGREDMLG